MNARIIREYCWFGSRWVLETDKARAEVLQPVKEYIEELQAENGSLRAELGVYKGSAQEDVIDYLRQECVDWEDAYRAVVSENAKLRELMTFYIRCLTKGHVNCDSCLLNGEDDCDHGRRVIERAERLGIEVNK